MNYEIDHYTGIWFGAVHRLAAVFDMLSSLLAELADLPLIRLDFSCNKITEIPAAYRKLRQLQHIILDNNPMQSPPAQAGSFTS